MIFLHIAAFSMIGPHDYVNKADVIVVFGNTVNHDGALSHRLKSRLDKGLEIFRLGYANYIIVSGAFGKEGYDEAQVMKQYLTEQGVAADKILKNSQGCNTLATTNNAKKLMEEKNLHSVILVSQYFHIVSAKYTFKKIEISQVYHAHANIFEWRDLYSLPREIIAFYKYLFLKNL